LLLLLCPFSCSLFGTFFGSFFHRH
jgi:hypothetical protein